MEKKIRKILMIIYIVAIISMISASTFAYFTYLQVSNVSSKIDSSSAKINDLILFDIENNIDINANEENFGQSMASLVQDVGASATLITEEVKDVTYKYNLFLDINKNTFDYTTDAKNAEVVLSVISPDGKEVTEIDGLNYISVTDAKGTVIKGFDITNATGRFFLAKAYEIRSNNNLNTVHNWNVQVTFVNFVTEQNENVGKEIRGNLKIEQTM